MKHVVVKLTEIEARNLSHAVANTTEFPDVMEATFDDAIQRKAVCRAAQKLDQAIYDYAFGKG